jgi:hypothetical protein
VHGCSVGGKRRARKLSLKRHADIARKAAAVRWERGSGQPEAVFDILAVPYARINSRKNSRFQADRDHWLELKRQRYRTNRAELDS